MTKRIFGLVIVLTLALSLFVIDVNAEYCLTLNFDDGNLGVWDATNDPDGSIREIVDGAMHLYNPTTSAMSQRTYMSVSSITTNAVFQYDYCRNSNEGYFIINLYLGNEIGRFMLNHEGNGYLYGSPYAQLPESKEEIGVWYTYVWDMKVNLNSEGALDLANSTMDIYRKRRDVDEPFVFVGTAKSESNKSKAQVQPYCAKGFEGYFDNVKFYRGTFAEGTVFEMDGAEVNALSDIKDGELKISTKIVTTKIEDCTVTPMLVVYNKNNKMIHNTILDNTELKMGENELEFSIDTTSFAHKLNGGYIGFYIWDNLGSLQPVAKAIELK